MTGIPNGASILLTNSMTGETEKEDASTWTQFPRLKGEERAGHLSTQKKVNEASWVKERKEHIQHQPKNWLEKWH
jgi:hypothetical protein